MRRMVQASKRRESRVERSSQRYINTICGIIKVSASATRHLLMIFFDFNEGLSDYIERISPIWILYQVSTEAVKCNLCSLMFCLDSTGALLGFTLKTKG